MKILVAVDKSEESQVALRYSCHLMEHFPAIVDAIYVKPDVFETTTEGGGYAPFTTKSDVEREIEPQADKTIEEIIESCEICVGGRFPAIPWWRWATRPMKSCNCGQPGLLRYDCPGLPQPLTHERFFTGAVHIKVLHHAQQPVLILRNFRPIQKILVAYRGSQCDQGALEFIAPLFARKKPEITVLHVQETERGESEEFAEACLLTGDETLRRYGYTPVKKMVKGDFVEEILKAVAVERYDLLVLGAYGHKLPKYLKLISDEAINLVRLTTRPVLVYREAK